MSIDENPIILDQKTIAKNTIYNFIGYIIPIVFAIGLIPLLIKKLGIERFGILNIVWMVIGYFSFLDFGVGRGLTKVVSEKLGLRKEHEIPHIFWASIFIIFSISILSSTILFFYVPTIVNFFNISDKNREEVIATFYILILSIPIVTTTAGLRGILEAYQKFSTISILRIITGIFTFLGPIIILLFVNSLYWVVFFLIVLRFSLTVIHLLKCFEVNSSIMKGIKLKLKVLQPVLNFSIWITLSNIVGPIILYSDRFLIGSLITVSSVAYYATPYEIVTKLLLISGSLVGVLFPTFSASFLNNPQFARVIFFRGIKSLILILIPIVFLILTFSYEGINIWLGKDFATNSSSILQFLSVGVLMNCLSSIPDTYFQSIGKPKISTLVMLFELPFYLIIMWYSIKTYGINGAALTFMCLAVINAIIMYSIAARIFSIKINSLLRILPVALFIIGLVLPFFLVTIFSKIVISIIFILLFFTIVWKYLFTPEERKFLTSKIYTLSN